MSNRIKFTLPALFLLTLLVLSPSILMAQAEYVRYNDEVYDFLERLSDLHIISVYNDLERPASRRTIAVKIKEAAANVNMLNSSDRKLLEKFKTEYEVELYGTALQSSNLIADKKILPFNQRNKFIYFLHDSGKASIFANLKFDVYQLQRKIYNGGSNKSALAYSYGGELRGTFLSKFGFYVKATDGKVSGEKDVARKINEIRYDYKFNSDPAVISGTDYFNNTEGYITADFDMLKLKYGRDVKTIGYGPVKHILGDNVPKFDYLSLALSYKGFSFSFMHGKLMGSLTNREDPVEGGIRGVTPKYFVYHRAGFDSRHISVGAGEMIVYSRREIDLSYLNPFAFYKSLEHSNQDRDNTLLFVDAANNSIPGLKVATSIMLDDMTVGKIGKGWYGNQLLFNAAVFSSNLYKIAPVDLQIQYTRINPYVYTHRISDNSYSNSGNPLAAPLLPNSSSVFLRAVYHPVYNLKFRLDMAYSVHGANELNDDGTIKRNVGGDPAVGYRLGDSQTANFLDGIREHYRTVSLTITYEPWKDYFLSLQLEMENNSLQTSARKQLYSVLIFDFKL